jgi:hypothetical protein
MDGSLSLGHGVDIAPGFCSLPASAQNSLDLLPGWVSAMPEGSGLEAGGLAHFDDARVPWAARVMGGLANKSVLEVGPYEAYNTYQFEQMGASQVTAIESSRLNFMRCLVIKNLFGLRSEFLLGDAISFMESTERRYDVAWLSGVLYHMVDPLALLRAAAGVSNRIFLWTHYHANEMAAGTEYFFDSKRNQTQTVGDREVLLHYRNYMHAKTSTFSGGADDHSYWMSKDDILGVLADLGFSQIQVGLDVPDYANGPVFFLLASR